MMRHKLFFMMVLMALPCMAQEHYQFSTRVKPLIKTAWGQGDPFNKLCPWKKTEEKSVHDLAGCGPVAMGQVMYYYRHPQMAPDKTFAYQWTKMFTVLDEYVDATQIFEVGKLLNDCGQSAFTKYGEQRSGTNALKMLVALKRHYGYSRYMRLVKRTQRTDHEWHRMVEEELTAGRPVVMCARKAGKGGHIFIIDGCKGDKVHVNFGWKGKDDGYYLLDDLNGYSVRQVMIVGIQPDTQQPDFRDIQLTEAGTLASHQLQGEHFLRITGPMDRRDFACLRQLSDSTGTLYGLDLRQATISELPDSAFFQCTSLAAVSLPEGLKTIGYAAFGRCRNLNYVDLPASVQVIGRRAFSGSGLIDIQLPAGLQRLGLNAFRSCPFLPEVQVPSSVWQEKAPNKFG